jgi:hypothetical protein
LHEAVACLNLKIITMVLKDGFTILSEDQSIPMYLKGAMKDAY